MCYKDNFSRKKPLLKYVTEKLKNPFCLERTQKGKLVNVLSFCLWINFLLWEIQPKFDIKKTSSIYARNKTKIFGKVKISNICNMRNVCKYIWIPQCVAQKLVKQPGCLSKNYFCTSDDVISYLQNQWAILQVSENDYLFKISIKRKSAALNSSGHACNRTTQN